MSRHRLWNLWLPTTTVTIIFSLSTVVYVNGGSNQNTVPAVRGSITAPPKNEEQHFLVGGKEDFISYVAEWEYEAGGGNTGEDEQEDLDDFHHQLSPLDERKGKVGVKQDESLSWNVDFPSKRVGPTTWQDSSGSWWLFGGQGPVTTNVNTSIQLLSDLWLYDTMSEPTVWRQIFQSQKDSKTPISAYPDNLAFPLLCGSSANSHVTVFGSGPNSGPAQTPGKQSPDSGSSPNSLFTDDNIVWLYDIPKWKSHKSETSNETSANANPELEPGVWTSYICCDACLPDDNTTTLEFCPHFSDNVGNGEKEPILWCSEDSLMALQLTSKRYSHKFKGEEEKSITTPESSTNTFKLGSKNHSPSTFSGPGQPPLSSANAVGKNKSIPESVSGKSIDTKQRSGSETYEENVGDSLNWWKFDLGETEWKKMPQVSLMGSDEIRTQIFGPNCRSVSDQFSVYILCPPIPTLSTGWKEKKQDSLIRDVFVFDPSKNSISWLSQLTLNNAFRDKRIWELGRSILHALRSERSADSNQTIIFLAYQKLLDLWIHDRRTGRLYSVENVWRGSTLHKFQTWSSFYKLRITIPSYSDGGGGGGDDDDESQSQPGKNSSHIVFMANPRTKLFTFNDPRPSTTTSFHITLQTDQSVFLPSRDASFLINPEDQVTKSSNASLPPRLAPTSKPMPKPKSTLNLFSGRTKIIGSLDPMSTTTATPPSPILTGEKKKSQSNVIDFNGPRGGSVILSPNLTAITNANANTTHEPVPTTNTTTTATANAPGLKSNLRSGIDNESATGDRNPEPSNSNTSSITTPVTTNASISGNRNSSGSEGKSTGGISTSSSGEKGNSVGSAHSGKSTTTTARPTTTLESHSHGSLSKHLVGIKRSFIKGTIDPPKLENSTSSSIVNNESRVGKPLEMRSMVESTRTSTTTPASGGINLNYNNNENRKKIMKSGYPVVPGKIQSKPRTNFEEDTVAGVLALGVKKNMSTNTNSQTIRRGNDSTVKFDTGNQNSTPKAEAVTISTISLDRAEGGRFKEIERDVENDQLNDENNGGRRSPLVFTSSEVIGDRSRDDESSNSERNYSSSIPSSSEGSPYSSMLFFAISISFFATIGIVLFIRRCVKCPPRRQSVLLKEPPPIRYSVIPDELSYHTPIV